MLHRLALLRPVGPGLWALGPGKRALAPSTALLSSSPGLRAGNMPQVPFLPSSLLKTTIYLPRQVEVDEAAIQSRLGKVNMDFIKKAEKRNKERAKMHRFFRRKDWVIASVCFGMVCNH
jgi:hypothetical protein